MGFVLHLYPYTPRMMYELRPQCTGHPPVVESEGDRTVVDSASQLGSYPIGKFEK